jgi:hypothetical protein
VAPVSPRIRPRRRASRETTAARSSRRGQRHSSVRMYDEEQLQTRNTPSWSPGSNSRLRKLTQRPAVSCGSKRPSEHHLSFSPSESKSLRRSRLPR